MRTKLKVLEKPDGFVAILVPNPRFRLWKGTPNSLRELTFERLEPDENGIEWMVEVKKHEITMVLPEAVRRGLTLEEYMKRGFTLPKETYLEIRPNLPNDMHPLVRDDIIFRQISERFDPAESDDDHVDREWAKIDRREDTNHAGFIGKWNLYPEEQPWWFEKKGFRPLRYFRRNAYRQNEKKKVLWDDKRVTTQMEVSEMLRWYELPPRGNYTENGISEMVMRWRKEAAPQCSAFVPPKNALPPPMPRKPVNHDDPAVPTMKGFENVRQMRRLCKA
jgi:hypothetical protein